MRNVMRRSVVVASALNPPKSCTRNYDTMAAQATGQGFWKLLCCCDGGPNAVKGVFGSQ